MAEALKILAIAEVLCLLCQIAIQPVGADSTVSVRFRNQSNVSMEAGSFVEITVELHGDLRPNATVVVTCLTKAETAKGTYKYILRLLELCCSTI